MPVSWAPAPLQQRPTAALTLQRDGAVVDVVGDGGGVEAGAEERHVDKVHLLPAARVCTPQSRHGARVVAAWLWRRGPRQSCCSGGVWGHASRTRPRTAPGVGLRRSVVRTWPRLRVGVRPHLLPRSRKESRAPVAGSVAPTMVSVPWSYALPPTASASSTCLRARDAHKRVGPAEAGTALPVGAHGV